MLTFVLKRSTLVLNPASEVSKAMETAQSRQSASPALYTAEERRRRDQSRWTLVQGILAPVQFVAFAVSAVLVIRYLAGGEGYLAATVSILVKTLLLYTIMVTGAIWEKDVFGCYLFARPFFWEDVVSMLVIALHTAYLLVLVTGWLDARGQMLLALTAYLTYVINAAQFVFKLRAARLQRAALPEREAPAGATGSDRLGYAE
jgi:3-vinyl bacteriochlorophyllide hydratase